MKKFKFIFTNDQLNQLELIISNYLSFQIDFKNKSISINQKLFLYLIGRFYYKICKKSLLYQKEYSIIMELDEAIAFHCFFSPIINNLDGYSSAIVSPILNEIGATIC
jgi:hypothetical protein